MTGLDRRTLIALAAITLMWGVNWPMMKFSLRELTPVFFRAVTMSAGALLLLAYYRARGLSLRLPRQAIVPVALLALPNIFGWHLFAILGVSELASGRAAVLGFTMPLWTVLLGIVLFGQPLSRRVLVSAVCAVLALGLLIADEITAMAGRPLGVLWMQLAAASWALGTLMMRRTTLAVPTETITVWMLMMSAALFWLAAPVLEPWPDWRFSAPMWAALAWGAVINYAVSQVLWFGLARRLPPTAVTFSIMAVPLVGTLSATVIVGEVPGTADLVAAFAVMASIAAALLPGRRAAEAAR